LKVDQRGLQIVWNRFKIRFRPLHEGSICLQFKGLPLPVDFRYIEIGQIVIHGLLDAGGLDNGLQVARVILSLVALEIEHFEVDGRLCDSVHHLVVVVIVIYRLGESFFVVFLDDDAGS
jgi:hypothetical protein